MSKHSSDPAAERLLELSDEVMRIAGSLAQLSMGLAAPLQQQERPTDPNEVSSETVSRLIEARRQRSRYVSSELFGEPAWDMLLDLLDAELAYRRVSVSSLCTASGVPSSTALRWLKCLEQRGLVVRTANTSDASSASVQLSLEGSRALRRYVREVVEARQGGEGAGTLEP